MIPNESGKGIMDPEAKGDINAFLARVEEYYLSRTMHNLDYGMDLKEENSCKRFISKRADDKDFSVGKAWIEEFMQE